MADRGQAVDNLADRFAERAGDLGLDGAVGLRYRPRAKATDASGLAAELAERVDADLERGFTGHGPHRDELVLEHDGRELRAYGSQGQQRLALLALLLAEREAVGEARGGLPLMLLDDVMSELDADRRRLLVDLLRAGGQSVITTTDLAHVPTAEDADVARLAIANGAVLQDAKAA
jgi:DNA replication and repair protein RecF